jgi:SAM-dependent methyltransferase
LNFKQLLPTYRARYRFVRDLVSKLPRGKEGLARVLNLGSGEGDYDAMIAAHFRQMLSCDVNVGDVRFASALNRDVDNLRYAIADGTRLPFADGSLDLILAIEVIEHVDAPEALLDEIQRTLKPGGTLILTCPNHYFPLIYDPINFVLRRLWRPISIGAYAYGHQKLVREAEMERWLAARDLRIEARTKLSRPLSAIVELYWPGLLQAPLKANARNRAASRGGRLHLRPSRREPWLARVTDLLIDLDARLFSWSRRSVGLGYVARRATGRGDSRGAAS